MTKTFGQEKNSHVAKSKTSGPLQSIIKKVQKDGKKLETVIEKDEKFVIEQMIRAQKDKASSRKLINATEYFRKNVVLPKGFKKIYAIGVRQ